MQRLLPIAETPFPIIGVQRGLPTATLSLLHRHAGVVKPALVGIIDIAIRLRSPYGQWQGFGQLTVMSFTGTERVLGCDAPEYRLFQIDIRIPQVQRTAPGS